MSRPLAVNSNFERNIMKISEVIEYLQKELKYKGDVELHVVGDDGRSSWVSKFSPIIVFEKRWPSKTKQYFIKQSGY